MREPLKMRESLMTSALEWAVLEQFAAQIDHLERQYRTVDAAGNFAAAGELAQDIVSAKCQRRLLVYQRTREVAAYLLGYYDLNPAINASVAAAARAEVKSFLARYLY